MELMAGLPTPIISIVTGEGGSGGALAIGVGNRVRMMEYSIYSVISPEACSSILYRDPSKAEKAAESLKLTAKDLLAFKVIDEIIPEPLGGAHREPQVAADEVASALRKHLAPVRRLSGAMLIEDRYRNFLPLVVFSAN